MNRIYINPERTLGDIDRKLFGGFAEHMGRCIYGGIYEPGSPHARPDGLRQDVLDALRRMRMPIMRYPGGNFVSGYRWRDGVGPERAARRELAWGAVEPNTFGTNEFIDFCRELDTEPFLVVNCGDGDMREARDWVAYCNSPTNTTLGQLRESHGYAGPHNVKYWGIGNEVDGHWQIGYKTPEEYARAFTEFGKVMKWIDPDIKLVAAGASDWNGDLLKRAELLIDQAGDMIDYYDIHWYLRNENDDFAAYMAVSERVEDMLSGFEGIIRAMRLHKRIEREIPLAVCEWNAVFSERIAPHEGLYNLEDALVVAIQLNALIRHARTVRMANIAQIVNILGPLLTRTDDLLLQTIFYPFELYSTLCGSVALDPFWMGETFEGGGRTGVRVLDVTATLNGRELVVFIVNRSTEASDAEIKLDEGRFTGEVVRNVIGGPGIKAKNTFESPETVITRELPPLKAEGQTLTVTLEPHSVTALRCKIA